jgi:hypothetical protein
MDAHWIFEVITLSEAAAWWGKSPRAVCLKLERWENKNPDRVALRRSGRVYLTTITVMREVYGKPKNSRPVYDS